MSISNLQSYSIANVYVTSPGKGTQLLAEQGEVTIDLDTAAQPVKTVQKGFAGVSPGAGVTTFRVTNAVPSADFEYDPTPFMVDLLPVKFTIFMANSTYSVDAIIHTASWTHGVNQEAKLSFEAWGSMTTWQSL